MGNGCGKVGVCFNGGRRHQDIDILITEPLDEGLGHSFCYVRPDPCRVLSTSKVHSEDTTMFRSISGASVSANTSTHPLSTSFIDLYSYNSLDRASAFESSTSFASIPLQPIPKCFLNSDQFSGGISGSGPLDRGFFSGPIERGFMSGPLDRGIFSGPLEKKSDQFQRSFSHGGFGFRPKLKKGSFVRNLKKAILKRISRGQKSIVAPIKGGVVSVKEFDWMVGSEKTGENELTVSSTTNLSSDFSLDYDESFESQNLQWAQGKAGEDRVQVVISEEHGLKLKGLLWEDKFETTSVTDSNSEKVGSFLIDESEDQSRTDNHDSESCSQCVEPENYPSRLEDLNSKRGIGKNSKNRFRGAAKKWEENQRRWKCEWDRERVELDRKLKEELNRSGSGGVKNVNHSDVLKALSRALKKTEEAYFDIADKMLMENPELAMMGSCLLVVLMKGEDVYLMNVGDSRAVLAHKSEPDLGLGKVHRDLDQIKEETLHDLEDSDINQSDTLPTLTALQLTVDHSTSAEEEVQRIKSEHRDDAFAVVNDRVKGSLNVTRAFGAGFLKQQPKWNNALLEAFRIDYVGTSPYITCFPSLHHQRLGPRDRFLILSSDGLYQYFTNEEAVSEVEMFIASFPEGDPAQHLVEEVLFRAAKKAGLDFHELLEIPQGDRRRYHDDVSIIVISFEGRIWRSCV
ncbi:Protein phosphatase 2C (PP2C)-like domain [Macleaya cordata]|uniref:Protein phosphatase 2C (PP2C)-like domain n=1 Tax=Macleaya cordata TaxID=56857 RepID=A0A200R6Q0_MACCD|nr:Protein phosphatase 2C (PP2C)-like domain [Macleaya cordata]